MTFLTCCAWSELLPRSSLSSQRKSYQKCGCVSQIETHHPGQHLPRLCGCIMYTLELRCMPVEPSLLQVL